MGTRLVLEVISECGFCLLSRFSVHSFEMKKELMTGRLSQRISKFPPKYYKAILLANQYAANNLIRGLAREIKAANEIIINNFHLSYTL